MTNEFQRLKWIWAGLPSFTLADLAIDAERLSQILSWWRSDPAKPARLHIVGWVDRISVLSEAITADPSSLSLSSPLQALPPDLPGVHRISLDEACVTLTLFVGERIAAVTQLRGHVDAVWTEKRLVCDAGAIQSLLKRNRLERDPWLAERHPPAVKSAKGQEKTVIIVGGGLAGMTIARALASSGWQVTVLDGDGVTEPSLHSGHHSAAITPQISTDDDHRARLSRAGLLSALSQWRDVPASIANWCGSIQLERLEGGRVVDLQDQAKTLGFDQGWVRYVDRDEASVLAGSPVNRGGLYFSMSCQVQPNQLVAWLADIDGIAIVKKQVGRIARAGDVWQTYEQSCDRLLASATKIILANSTQSKGLLAQSNLLAERARLQGLQALGGEISLIPLSAVDGGPSMIIGGDGYVLPAKDGLCVSGATYIHAPQRVETTHAGRHRNLDRAADLLGLPLLGQSLAADELAGWAGLRAVLPGRFPAIGPLNEVPGLWVATGFASRGLTWSSLAADLILAAFEGQPIPLENDLLKEVNPN